MKRPVFQLLAVAVSALLTASCAHYENRIPPSVVRLPFNTVGDWNTYGISGAYSHANFIKEEGVPANYPYTTISETGFGGILLVTDMHGDYHAYDLACPVEMKRNVRVSIDPEQFIARCEVCGSTYDVFDNLGVPLTGPARDYGYRLARYNVGPGLNGEYMLVYH